MSRPGNVGRGFVNGHVFNKRPDLLNQCTACHGSRVGNEYIGKRGQGDVHALKANMGCVACHGAQEMHAASPMDVENRYHAKNQVRCTDCHKDLQHGSVRDHTIHIGKVQCQVCHSQTYTNCYSCHTGTGFFMLRYLGFSDVRMHDSSWVGWERFVRYPQCRYPCRGSR